MDCKRSWEVSSVNRMLMNIRIHRRAAQKAKEVIRNKRSRRQTVLEK